MFLPHFDVFCDLLLNRRTATWNLFVLYNTDEEAFFISKCFNISYITRKPAFAGPLPTLANTKKAIWRDLLSIQNKAISLVAMRSKELWQVQENHATVKIERSFSWNENLQRKHNWTTKSTNLKENTGQVKAVFVIRAALWAEKFGSCLEYCRGWTNTLGKLAVVVNLAAIRFEFWMKGALLSVKICVLCGWWFSNQFEIVSETPFTCNTGGRER